MTKKLQVYETPEITVSYDPNVCRHSGVCLGMLPDVFDVRRARWIQPEQAAPERVAATIQRCPSGALQFYRNSPDDPGAAERLAKRIQLNEIAMEEADEA
ncbi:MAG TPA: (4Fe-4S)-binding protein [Candidatus Krumholzibacteria bacterium]|nr:(4Fe-4S)-binding protein [Candidatus Krumholzibacteria bacterium]